MTAKETKEIQYIEIQNRLNNLVFIPAGLILEGETQNRASIYPVLVPPRSGQLRLDVNCAEELQDLLEGAHFVKANTMLMASARSGMIDQSTAWSKIKATIASLGTTSQTQDYASVVKRAGLEDYIGFMGAPQKRQLGYIVAIQEEGNVLIYADLFGSHELYVKHHRMLHESVAAVAKQYRQAISADKSMFEQFRQAVGRARWHRHYQDHGFEGQLYVCAKPIEGCALLHERQTVQISLRKDVAQKEWDPKRTMYFTS